jgi:hypothetical protein
MRDDEDFYRWLDGELTGEAADRVAAQVAADPELRLLAEQHRALGARLKNAFAPIADAPAPASLRAAVRPSAEIIQLAAAREARREEPPSRLQQRWQWGAIAASLAVGIIVGSTMLGGSSAPIQQKNGQLVAAAGLEQALDIRLASAPERGGPRIGLTFRDRDGAVCRSFSGERTSGLACRADGNWRIRGLFQEQEAAPGEYRMASARNPQLAALIETQMQGEPLDAAQERAAQEKGWR